MPRPTETAPADVPETEGQPDAEIPARNTPRHNPLLPITRSLQRLHRRIDSFSFDNTSPEFSSNNSSNCNDSATSSPSTAAATTATPPAVLQPPASTAVVAGTTSRSSYVELRSGLQYRRRAASTPTQKDSVGKSITNSSKNLELVNPPAPISFIDQCCKSGKGVDTPTHGLPSPNKQVAISHPDLTSRNKQVATIPPDQTHPGSPESPPLNTTNSVSTRTMDLSKINQLVHDNIPLLYGDEPSELKTFLKCCDYVMECLSAEDHRLFLRLLPTRLRGKASDLVDGSEVRNYEDLKRTLRERLIPSRPYLVCVSELQQSRQLPGESLASFGRRLANILTECEEKAEGRHAGAAKAVKEDLRELAMHTFKAGASNLHHRIYMSQSADRTLGELINKAEKMEEAEHYVVAHPEFNSSTPVAYTTPRTYPTSLPPVYNHPTQFNIPYEGNQRDRVRWQDRWPQASTPGHEPPTQGPYHRDSIPTQGQYHPHSSTQNRAWNTPSRGYSTAEREIAPAGPQPATIKQEPPPPRRPVQKCDFCGREGHYYKDCRTRKSTPYCSQCRTYGHTIQACPNRTGGGSRRPQINMVQGATGPLQRTRSKCEFCGRWGHALEECLTKQRWESRNSAAGTSHQPGSPSQPENY